MTREQFHKLMTDPKTPARLDAMLADNARVDAERELVWYPCACGADHDTPTCPFDAGPARPYEVE